MPLVEIRSEWSKWWTFIYVLGCNKKNRGNLQRVPMHAVVVDSLHQWFRRNLILYDNPRHEEIFIVVFLHLPPSFFRVRSLSFSARLKIRDSPPESTGGFLCRFFTFSDQWCMVMHAKTSPRDKVEGTSLRGVRKKKSYVFAQVSDTAPKLEKVMLDVNGIRGGRMMILLLSRTRVNDGSFLLATEAECKTHVNLNSYGSSCRNIPDLWRYGAACTLHFATATLFEKASENL